MTQQKRMPFATLVLGAALVAMPSAPALAASCPEPLDMVVARYEAAGNDTVMLNDDEIGAAMEQFDIPDISRGFYVEIDARMILGLEVDGCLLPPIEMTQPLKATRLSGATGFGIYA
jgi:hypothetical protein